MENSYTIFKVSWLTRQPGMEDDRDNSIEICYQITKFLQDNGLLQRQMIGSRSDITDEFLISAEDLTAEGLEFMKKNFSRWLQKTDDGMDPADVTILERALKRLRFGG